MKKGAQSKKSVPSDEEHFPLTSEEICCRVICPFYTCVAGGFLAAHFGCTDASSVAIAASAGGAAYLVGRHLAPPLQIAEDDGWKKMYDDDGSWQRYGIDEESEKGRKIIAKNAKRRKNFTK